MEISSTRNVSEKSQGRTQTTLILSPEREQIMESIYVKIQAHHYYFTTYICSHNHSSLHEVTNKLDKARPIRFRVHTTYIISVPSSCLLYDSLSHLPSIVIL